MLVRIFWVASFLFFAATNALGCMCGATSVCDAYAGAGAVVIAEVINFKPKDIPLDRIFVGGDPMKTEPGQAVDLKISKWFKGGSQKNITLMQPNSTCDWSFDESNFKKQYLFYLSYNKKHGEYSIVSCGRSTEVSKAHDDMSWLSGLPRSLKRTRISGVTQVSNKTFSSIADIKVSIKSKAISIDLTTDENGLYEKWDVPVGKYRITAKPPPDLFLSWTTSIPDNWTYFWSFGDADPKSLDVTIEPQKCGGIDFMFKKND